MSTPTDTSKARYCVNCRQAVTDQDGRYWCNALVNEKRKSPVACSYMRLNACVGGKLFTSKEGS